MRLTLTLLCLTALPATLAAQTPELARNAVYFELAGNGLLYSVNYDRRLKDDFTARIGVMYIGVSGESAETGEKADVNFAVIPIMANWLLGEGAGRFELGIGPIFAIGSAEVEEIDGTREEFDGVGPAGVTSTIGFRYQPEDGGVVFRIGATPFWSGEPQLWAGISLGYAF